jgi:hypothetical protein
MLVLHPAICGLHIFICMYVHSYARVMIACIYVCVCVLIVCIHAVVVIILQFFNLRTPNYISPPLVQSNRVLPELEAVVQGWKHCFLSHFIKRFRPKGRGAGTALERSAI